MTRKTNFIQADGDTYNKSRELDTTGFWDWFDKEMDKFWDLIEDKYEEEWRVEFNGTMSLQVTDALLQRIRRDNPEAARDLYSDKFIGLWSIEGVYSNYYTLVDGPRTYSFEQGA